MTAPLSAQATAAVAEMAAQGVVDNADRLGLTWQFRLGTIENGATPSAITIVMDGDETAVTARSLIGVLSAGCRAMCVITPDSIFVVGFGNERHSIYLGEMGTETLTFTSRTSFTQAVTFATPFPSAPNIHTNIHSGAGATAQWHSRAINITTTGFTLFVFTTIASAWTSIPVQWSAFLTPPV